MKLLILDRLNLSRILPAEGDILTIRTLKKVREKLSFTPEEVKKFKIKSNQSKDGKSTFITWDNKVAKIETDVKLVGEERKLLLKQFEDLDKNKKMTETLVETYDRLKKFHEEIEKKG